MHFKAIYIDCSSGGFREHRFTFDVSRFKSERDAFAAATFLAYDLARRSEKLLELSFFRFI